AGDLEIVEYGYAHRHRHCLRYQAGAIAPGVDSSVSTPLLRQLTEETGGYQFSVTDVAEAPEGCRPSPRPPAPDTTLRRGKAGVRSPLWQTRQRRDRHETANEIFRSNSARGLWPGIRALDSDKPTAPAGRAGAGAG